MKTAYILAAYRTAGCKAKKGKFKDMRPDDLAAAAISGLLERTGIEPLDVEDIIMGCAFPEGEQGMNMARVAAMRAGVPYQVPAQTVNRFCSSGLQTIATAAERIMAGFGDCIIAGVMLVDINQIVVPVQRIALQIAKEAHRKILG